MTEFVCDGTCAGNELGDCSHEADAKLKTAKMAEAVNDHLEEHVPVWEDKDDEFSDAINAAFPTRSGSHEHYATAMKMVGNRHSKSSLVSLVNWLLVERDGIKQKTLESVGVR